MERLTKRINGIVTYYPQNCQYDTGLIAGEMVGGDVRTVLARLAAYEDTELEPEDVAELKSASELERKVGSIAGENLNRIIRSAEAVLAHIEDREELQAYRALGPVEELAALVKAQDEWRVVVLDMPRKPLVWGDDEHDTCLCPDCGEDLMGIPYDASPVAHGRWIKHDGYTECSKCEYWYDSAENEDAGDRSNYCPNCGAPMDGGEDDG